MKLSIRVATLAITAVALAGALGAQQRTNAHSGARSQPPRSQAGSRAQAGAQVRVQHYAPSRADFGGGRYAAQPRGNSRVQASYQARGNPAGQNGYQARNDFRDRSGYRVPVAEHGRPLITRVSAPGREYGRSPAYAGARIGGDRGFRGGREFRDGRWFFGGRAFPLGWEGRVVFGGFFPMAYGGYCDAVPYDYDYLLPPMLPSYDPCLFGDRVIVFDRFSRHIVFVATL
ncbi:MAG: hypothetical protein ACHQQR_01685 [Gemmatimonadales bacterium]